MVSYCKMTFLRRALYGTEGLRKPFSVRPLPSRMYSAETPEETAKPLRRRKDAKPWTAQHSKSRGSYFVDWKRTRVVAGKGGDGCISMASLKGTEFAGPDGGDGGNGAHVIFKVDV